MLPTLFLTAQEEFAPVGAKWYYDYTGYGLKGYVVIESIKDTMIQNKESKKLRETFISYSFIDEKLDTVTNENKFLYQSNDSIFHFINGHFSLLYHFNPQIDDIWNLTSYYSECDTGSIEISSISEYMFADTIFNAIYTTPIEGSFVGYGLAGNGIIIEQIGNIQGYLFPRPTDTCGLFDINSSTHLRCYEKEETLYQFSLEDCRHIENYSSINRLPKINLKTYPNPVYDYLNITHPSDLYISILDTNGQIVFRAIVNENESSFNISNLPSGIYYVLAVNEKNGFGVKKIIKV